MCVCRERGLFGSYFALTRGHTASRLCTLCLTLLRKRGCVITGYVVRMVSRLLSSRRNRYNNFVSFLFCFLQWNISDLWRSSRAFMILFSSWSPNIYRKPYVYRPTTCPSLQTLRQVYMAPYWRFNPHSLSLTGFVLCASTGSYYTHVFIHFRLIYWCLLESSLPAFVVVVLWIVVYSFVGIINFPGGQWLRGVGERPVPTCRLITAYRSLIHAYVCSFISFFLVVGDWVNGASAPNGRAPFTHGPRQSRSATGTIYKGRPNRRRRWWWCQRSVSSPVFFFFFTPHLYLVYYHDSLYTYTHTQFHTRSDGDIYIDGRSRKEQVGVGGVYLGRLYKLCDREQQEEQSGDDDLFCVMPSVRRILRGCFSFY